ncbi:MAG: Rieske 2Fe-2S domain-containing protein [Gammaproteobacteria bacterium]|nr:Rieske 2Fe-2S domain-containing protein [Gammaproteobacteria bacterium]
MIQRTELFSSLKNAWYPVSLSKELKRGQQRKVQLLDTHWLLFRTESGRPGITSRYCCHLGTDLSNGRVVGDNIECPMHGWQFDTHGNCTHIPCGAPIPNGAQQFSLQLTERFGIIFVWYGDKPEFDFPEMSDLSTNLKTSPPITVSLQAPYYVAALNSFDTQHYEKIHARRFVSPPDISLVNPYCLRIDYTAEIIRRRWVDKIMTKLCGDTTSVAIESWSGGILLLKNMDTHYGSLIGVHPSSETHCELYIVALKDREVRQTLTNSLAEYLALRLAAVFLKTYLAPDLGIIANMQPHKGILLDGVDDALQTFFDYWKALPQKSPFRLRENRKVA